jgi:hypothetical protein
MAYGRLDVFWPDGNFNSYMLDTPTVSVGRAEGNTIALETETISRYHFNITHDNHAVSITDLESANGTFVDGVQIPAHQAIVLEGGAEIQIGHLRMIYQPVDESPTVPITPAQEDTWRMEKQEAGFRLALDNAVLETWPASSSSTELALTNAGKERRRFSVMVTGIQERWVRVNRPELEVDPGETAYVLINVKPSRHPNNVPMEYAVGIEVAPLDTPDMKVVAPLRVMIKGYSGLGVALGTRQLEMGETLRLYLHNQGNETVTLKIWGKASNDMLRFTLPDAPVTLAAGQRLQVTSDIRPKTRPFTGNTVEQPFHILVQAQTPAAYLLPLSGSLTLKPLLPTWGVLSIGGILASVVLIVLLLITGILNPPNPQIIQFNVNQERLAEGDPLILTWETRDAAALKILVNNTEIPGPVPDATRFEIPTSGISGEVTIELIAENRGREARVSRAVFIYVPMNVKVFTVEPTEMVYNIVTTLTIIWDVPGAVKTTLSGLEPFTNAAAIQNTYEASGTLAGIGGIATAPLTIILRAEDEVGNILEESINIALIDPVCTANVETTLHEGPDVRYQTVGTLQTGVNVVVNAQSGDGDWLRVLLAGDVPAWGQLSAFTCADTFAPADLRTELNVPPLPTLVPTAAPTATLPPPPPTPQLPGTAVPSTR